MPISLIAVAWNGESGFLLIEESDFDPNVHKVYVEPTVVKSRKRPIPNVSVTESI